MDPLDELPPESRRDVAAAVAAALGVSTEDAKDLVRAPSHATCGGDLLPNAALSLVDVRLSRGGATVLDGLSLTVPRGEVLAVRGPSGCGKTSLLALLSGFMVPSSGSISAFGVQISGLDERQRSRYRRTVCGVIFQTDELLPELTLLENVSLPLRLIGAPRRTSHYRGEIMGLLSELGVDALADRFPHEVSGGQLQRASIARALIHRPELVLADEPTENLDPAAAAAVGALISLSRNRGSTVVVVTHDADVANLCDRELTLSLVADPCRDDAGRA